MQTLVLEVFGPLLAAVVLLVAVNGAVQLFRYVRNRQTPEELQAARDAFRRRLIHPMAEAVERELGGELPQRLLALYEDHQTILSEELEVRRPNVAADEAGAWIEAFLPLDLESRKLTAEMSEQSGGQGFCFATDGAGNFYWMPVSETRQADAPVFYMRRDPLGSEQVAASLEEFLSWARPRHAPESPS